MRIQLIHPHNHFVSPQVFNRMFTMHGTTMIFFVAMPILFGFAQLPGAADDRRAGHGVSAAECVQLLDDGVRRIPALFQFYRRKRSVRRRQRAGRGMVGVCAADGARIFAGPQHRLLDDRVLVSGFGSIGTAINIIATILCMRCPGMTLGPHAAARVAEPGDVGHGADRDHAR